MCSQFGPIRGREVEKKCCDNCRDELRCVVQQQTATMILTSCLFGPQPETGCYAGRPLNIYTTEVRCDRTPCRRLRRRRLSRLRRVGVTSVRDCRRACVRAAVRGMREVYVYIIALCCRRPVSGNPSAIDVRTEAGRCVERSASSAFHIDVRHLRVCGPCVPALCLRC